MPNKNGAGWAVKEAGNDWPLAIFNTKERARQFGRNVAVINQSEHVIHKKDGRISDKDSYGNDPYPPKDWIH